MAKNTLSITDNRTGKAYELPIEDGAIKAIDLRQIKADEHDFGLVTYDPGLTNTASCKSRITYIDGDKGILWYRGYPIEQLAEESTFLETAYLLLYGELPTQKQLDDWTFNITHHTIIHRNIEKFIDGFHYDAHPMGMLVSTVAALSTFYPDAHKIKDQEARQIQIYRLIAKMPTLAAFTYRHSIGMPFAYPDNDLEIHRQFSEYAFQENGVEVPPGSGVAEGARYPVYFACGSRTKLQHKRDAKRGQFLRRSVFFACRRSRSALRPASRWGKRSCFADAHRNRFTR